MLDPHYPPLFKGNQNLIESKQIFSGAILELYVNRLQLPQGPQVEREIIHHLPAVAILPITDDDQVVLVKQFRPAINESIYEIPAGMLDGGPSESPLQGAQRELEEETHYQGTDWQSLGRFFASPGFLDEWMELFVARDLSKVEDPLPLDEDEFVEVATFTREEIQELLSQGQLKDLKTLYALQVWLSESLPAKKKGPTHD